MSTTTDTRESILLRTDEGGVTTLTLNRPQQFNSLSFEMLEALIAAVDEIARDESVRVVVLAAMGKSLNQAVRDHLEQLARAHALKEDLDAFAASARRTPGRLRGWKFDRDEANQRA